MNILLTVHQVPFLKNWLETVLVHVRVLHVHGSLYPSAFLFIIFVIVLVLVAVLLLCFVFVLFLS